MAELLLDSAPELDEVKDELEEAPALEIGQDEPEELPDDVPEDFSDGKPHDLRLSEDLLQRAKVVIPPGFPECAQPNYPKDPIISPNSTGKQLGVEGENLAAIYLVRRGYEIIERNWRSPYGEIDIIARDGAAIVLIEVKTRRSQLPSNEIMPELQVNERKIARYRRMALNYMFEHSFCTQLRFDVISVVVGSDRVGKLRHLLNAFGIGER